MKKMKRGNRKPLTPKLRAALKVVAVMPENEIDTSEMPPITDWSHGVRGQFYLPIKRPLPLSVDADIFDRTQRQR
jgi:hypothetical protein